MSDKLLLSPYDFTTCSQLTPQERIIRCISKIRTLHEKRAYQSFEDIPAVPSFGATEEEIQALETILTVQLPEDYRILLQQHRYIEYKQGVTIYGFDYQGIGICSRPFVIDNLFTSGKFLAVGDYWHFADGDQLFIALNELHQPIYAYFHEHGPRMEYFAPDVTSALWRIVFEKAET